MRIGPLADELRRLTAEALGTAFLLAAIVGSGIVTQQDGAASAQLFQHAIVVGAALVALILTFGPVSGAHFNPVVTLADAWFGGMPWSRAAAYVLAQLVGAVTGVAFTNLTFGRAAVETASVARDGGALVASEAAATAGLLLVIFGVVRSGGGRVVAGAVGTYIAAAIYFTASASFANPAVTLARAWTDTYTGIDPANVPGFVAGELIGAVAATVLIAWLFAPDPSEAAEVVVPHDGASPPVPRGRPTPPPATVTAEGSKELSMSTSSGAATPTVLFLCVHNAGRSQMAAGFLRHLAGPLVDVRSGGSEPATEINPVAIEAMHERGIDIVGQTPRAWTRDSLDVADVIVTMGCGDTCPVVPGTRYLDWELADPAGQPLEVVRDIRDEIERRVRQLMVELGVVPLEESAR